MALYFASLILFFFCNRLPLLVEFVDFHYSWSNFFLAVPVILHQTFQLLIVVSFVVRANIDAFVLFNSCSPFEDLQLALVTFHFLAVYILFLLERLFCSDACGVNFA